MINFELYRIFVIVAKEQNITSASKILNISQPAVTKHIQNLEELLNEKLFTRTNKGLMLTDFGETLYQKLEEPIHTIMEIDSQYGKVRNVNIGSHNHLLNRIFGACINEYYFEHKNVILNIKNFETDSMLKMLQSHELDIVFSKKVENMEYKNIKYIKLGYLHDIFIVSKNSKFSDGILKKEDLKKQIIYVPRTYAQTVKRLYDFMGEEILDLRNSSYSTILELVSKTDAIGFITKEYIDNVELKKRNLVEVDFENKLEPVEFGIYLNDKRFRELNDLINIIIKHFNYNEKL